MSARSAGDGQLTAGADSPETVPAAREAANGTLLRVELAFPPGEYRRLAGLIGEAAPARALTLRWHDSAKGELARSGFALAERRDGRRRVWQLWRIAGETAPPGLAEAVIAEAAERAALPAALPNGLAEVARFKGRSRTLGGAPAGVSAVLLSGRLRAGGAEERCRRLLLSGPGPDVGAFALVLAANLRLGLPGRGLAAEALGLAGLRRHQPPPIGERTEVAGAFAGLLARLTALLLAEAARAGPGDAEPVHQMRIAVRRLRSAIALFGRATRCAEADAARQGLKALATALAAARDWDVFVQEAAAPLAAALGTDAAVERLLRQAERRRLAGYRALARTLAGPEFRGLALALALLAASRPWERAAEVEEEAERRRKALALPLTEFAAAALEKRWRPLAKHEQAPTGMSAAELHRLRLRCKRLRYACEFFAPLFGQKAVRRFVRRLAAVQDRLGTLNDAAAAETLLARLGAHRSATGGVVRGYLAARAGEARGRIDRDWRRLRRLEPFWR